MSYEALLTDLEQLHKSYAEEDERIQQAAAQARQGVGADDEDPDAMRAEDGGDEDEDEDEDKDEDEDALAEGFDSAQGGAGVLGKSYVLVDEDGHEMEAVDGTAMVKSLTQRLHRFTRQSQTDKSALTKSMLALKGIVERQEKMIKALADQVAAVSGQGAGRRSVAMPSAALAKSMGSLTPDLIKSRADTAFKEGRLTGKEYMHIDVSLRNGWDINTDVAQRLLNA